MHKRWYYKRDGRTFGPFSDQQVISLAKVSVITANTLLYRRGLNMWTRAGTITGLTSRATSTDVPQAGVSISPDEVDRLWRDAVQANAEQAVFDDEYRRRPDKGTKPKATHADMNALLARFDEKNRHRGRDEGAITKALWLAVAVPVAVIVWLVQSRTALGPTDWMPQAATLRATTVQCRRLSVSMRMTRCDSMAFHRLTPRPRARQS
jgi:hypothetical protein